MPAPAGTSTAFRLARIALLLLGSLLFLYACENSKSALLADKWVEVAIAGTLLAAGLGAAWFEVKLTDYLDEDADEIQSVRAESRSGRAEMRGGRAKDRAVAKDPAVATSRARAKGRTGAHGLAGARSRAGAGKDRAENREFLVESEGWSMRAKIARSGDLIFHGHDLGGTYPAYEWMWIFHPDTFPEIRAALGDDEGEILELLEEVVPQLDRHGRHDPGAWLRAHDIPATYREKGVSATQETRELPILQPGLPQPAPRRDVPVSARAQLGRQYRDVAPVFDEDSVEPDVPVRARREALAPATFQDEDAGPGWPQRDPEPVHSRWRADEGAPYDDIAPTPHAEPARWRSSVPTPREDFEPVRPRYEVPEPARAQWNSGAVAYPPREDYEPARLPYGLPEPAGTQWDSDVAPYSPREDYEPARSLHAQPEPTRAQWNSSLAAYPSHEDLQPARSPYGEPEPARTQWHSAAPTYSPRDDFAPAAPPYEAAAVWQEDPAPPYDNPALPYENPVPAYESSAVSYDDPAPHWPTRDETARPPLERRNSKRSQHAQPDTEWPHHDSEPARSPYEDPAAARARRERLDAIQAQLENPSLAATERPYRRDAAQPQHHSRRRESDDPLPLQRRGSSPLPDDYPAAPRYEPLSSSRQRPTPVAEPSWPERSMPRQRQAPPEPPRQRDEYSRWTDQSPAEYDEPPARRHRRSSPPPNSAGSGRHAQSHGATPRWP
ncbi:hypothetical protein [Nocardia sp. CS682]|uniref:hypothetical protein n=1 Tax=Nocardia sp. CS682 TaxID=1047172 RepID=UPI001074EA8F|nr:hypothetical protein [Nocardia sp. CS682]QBS40441.1 hypothetical protein DMB37_10235 [Nocardia sp. CS682]